MMERKVLFNKLFILFFFYNFQYSVLAAQPPNLIYPPPDNVRNVMLVSSDMHQFKITDERYWQDPMADLWPINREPVTGLEGVPGIAHSFLGSNSFFFGVRYGYFENQEDARFGAEGCIPQQGGDALMIGYGKEGSFSGIQIGDFVYRWEETMEFRPTRERHFDDQAILGVSKGRYAFMIDAGWEGATAGTKDKTILEPIAQKIEKKIDVATSLDNFNAQLPQLITQQGILRSLQAKLDVFTKNYRKGDYKTALNDINAFINELDAQRGKHVNESAYQTLKGYADTIVQSLNALM